MVTSTGTMIYHNNQIKKRTIPTCGFTLMELLVATSILSIVMSSVYILFHSSIRTWRQLEKGTNPHQDARLIMSLIAKDIHNITASAGHLFEGEDNQFTLFSIVAPFNKEAGEGAHLMRIEYAYNRSKKQLEREEALVETALPKVPPPNRELDRSRIKVKKKKKFVIAEGVKDFEVRYIWMPVPENRDYKKPPEKITPVKAKKHKLCWWLPQGLEITIKLTDPDRPEESIEFKEVFPIRAPSAQMTMKQLQQLLKDVV